MIGRATVLAGDGALETTSYPPRTQRSMKDSWSLAIPIQHSNEQSVSYVALLTQAAWRSGSFGEPRL